MAMADVWRAARRAVQEVVTARAERARKLLGASPRACRPLPPLRETEDLIFARYFGCSMRTPES
jgi:hypothetical protein